MACQDGEAASVGGSGARRIRAKGPASGISGDWISSNVLPSSGSIVPEEAAEGLRSTKLSCGASTLGGTVAALAALEEDWKKHWPL
jgi:hypothetical protein